MKYQECVNCVMDTSDPEIAFNGQGVCSYCMNFESEVGQNWFPNETGKQKLSAIFERVREEGRDKEYDCIIGLSGGVDSSYVALVLKEYNLRPLVVHVDVGWNSELAVHNIEKIIKHCGYELFTRVVDWGEVRDLQLAYLKSGIANQDVVQDHVIFSSLYHFAVENDIRYVISGGNIATESVVVKAWHHAAMDARNLHAIHRRFGSVKLRDYKTISFFQYYLYYPLIRRMKTVRPLNYMPYDKARAVQELKEQVGYKEYGRKHGESRFTKFFQNHYLPKKFGYDKRRLHLSSQILAGSITREEAVQELKKPLYEPIELKEDKTFLAKKLGIGTEELDKFIEGPCKNYDEYANWDNMYRIAKKFQTLLGRALKREIKNYS